MILFLVPETKSQTLEQLDARFSIPTKTHASWALKEVIFVIRYYLLGRKGASRPILSVSTQERSSIRYAPASSTKTVDVDTTKKSQIPRLDSYGRRLVVPQATKNET